MNASHGHGHGHGHQHRAGVVQRLKHFVVPHSHDAADTVDGQLEASKEGMRALWISFAALLVTAAGQAVLLVFTGSVALLSDTLHNVADALTAIPLAIAFWLGRRAVTKRYTYGLGRAEDLAGLVVLVVIAASAVFAALEAIKRLVDPRELDHLGWLAVAGVIGFAGNELVAQYRIRVGRRIGSAALVADGVHARTDGFTSLAVVLSAGGAALGWTWADPVVGLLIALAIGTVLVGAAKPVFARLLDAVDPELLERAERVLRATPGVENVDQLRLRWVGHALHAEAEIAVDPTLSLVDAHEIAHRAEHALLHALKRLARANIHSHPSDASHEEVAHHREA